MSDPDATPLDEERALLGALVLPKHRQMYLTNAWFKASVVQLARFLPFLVDGLAASAANEETERRRRLHTITWGSLGGKP